MLVAARRPDFMEKHRDQYHLECKAKVTMRYYIQTFLLSYFEVSLFYFHLTLLLQLKSELVLLHFGIVVFGFQ
jgi:hypothetical protein